ncbi:hypothetical protein DMENIID0001_025810 [Sergentomyia squamirostris]
MSLLTCNSTLKAEKKFAQETIDEISNYFIELHGKLQVLESGLVNKVRDRFKENVSLVQKIQENLKSNKGQIEVNLEKLNYYARNTPYNLDLESLLKDINAFAKELPCDLNVSQPSRNPFTFEKPRHPVRMTADYDVRISETMKLRVNPCQNIRSPPRSKPSTSKYQSELMRSRSPRDRREHSHERVRRPRESQRSRERSVERSREHKSKNKSRKKSRSDLDKSNSSRDSSKHVPIVDITMDVDEPRVKKNKKSSRKKSSRKVQSMQEFPPPFARISLRPKIESESVCVSHIRNPHEIYIQNLTFFTSVDHFYKMCADVAVQQVKVEELVPKEIYLVAVGSEKNEKWYRCVLKSFNQQDHLYEVKLIDFGNTIKISNSKVRSCSAVLKKQPPNAIQCSLYNLKARKGKWTDEVNIMLTELVMSDTVTKMTLGVEGDIHIVDLIVMKNLSPVSIRDMLIKLHLAREVEANDYQMTRLIDDLTKQISAAQTATPKFYPQAVEVGGFFTPKVIHTVSPLEFYVVKAEDCPMYEELKVSMDKFYNDINGSQKIYSPEMGMAVAIHYQQHWHRAEITGLMSDLQIQVKLVDLGIEQQANMRTIRVLHADFIRLSKAAVACSLAHIAPLGSNDYKWTHEALETFRALTNSTNLELFVHSTHKSKPNFFNVTLYSVRKDKNISINGQLVHLEFAASTGAESVHVEFRKDTEEDESDKDASNSLGVTDTSGKVVGKKKSHRIHVKILNAINPGEFYVIFTHHLAGMDRVQNKIQKNMANYEAPAELPEWQLGDLCYVKTETPDEPVCEWRRASVRRKDDLTGDYEVFLIDAGVQLCVKKNAMAPIVDKSLDKGTCHGALQCHLSNIEPTGSGQVWASSSVDKFRNYCSSRKFDGYAVTMMGPWVNNSVPVVLWGRIEEDDALQPTIIHWKNINESLAKRGYAVIKEKFPETFDSEEIKLEMMKRNDEFEQFVDRLSECGVSDIPPVVKDSLLSQLTTEVTMVTEWKSAECWTEKIFIGIATCVDNNGMIYMYNLENKEVLERMRKIAGEMLTKTLPSPVEQFWSKNQPCMARYHVDQLFYRGIVRRVIKEKNKCLVHFVDYGNIEECSFDEMRKNLLFGNIPILSYRFKFSNLLPINQDDPWPCDVLDKMHGYTVGNECSVTLADPSNSSTTHKVYDIVYLRMGAFELFQYLIENGYAVRSTDPLKERKQLKCIKPQSENDEVETEDASEKLPLPRDLDSLNKYRDYFQKKDILEQIHPSKESDDKEDDEESDCNSDVKAEESDSDDSSSDDEVVETAPKKIRSEESSDEFAPLSVSTKITDPYDIFMPLVLDDKCNGFYGKATELTSALELFFFPEIEDHVTTHEQMDKTLQEAAAYYPSVRTVNSATAYLVRYNADNRWYRAIVNTDEAIDDDFLVRFVDYLNTEMVDMKHIKPLNVNLQSIPLRNIRLRLADVKLNPRYRPDDIERELRTILHQKRVYVKIISKGVHPKPHLVQIYASENDNEVIYEPLILNKYFVRQGKIN